MSLLVVSIDTRWKDVKLAQLLKCSPKSGPTRCSEIALRPSPNSLPTSDLPPRTAHRYLKVHFHPQSTDRAFKSQPTQPSLLGSQGLELRLRSLLGWTLAVVVGSLATRTLMPFPGSSQILRCGSKRPKLSPSSTAASHSVDSSLLWGLFFTARSSGWLILGNGRAVTVQGEEGESGTNSGGQPVREERRRG